MPEIFNKFFLNIFLKKMNVEHGVRDLEQKNSKIGRETLCNSHRRSGKSGDKKSDLCS
jgi:hypothetical protein